MTAYRHQEAFEDLLRYYSPLLSALMLVVLNGVVRWCMHDLNSRVAAAEHTAEIAFAMLGYWLWALLANAHMGTLVKEAGLAKGTVQQRQKEFLSLLIYTAGTIIVFVVCLNRGSDRLTWFLAVASVVVGGVSLGKRHDVKKA